MRVAVVGAGSWGTALAIMAARKGHDVYLWSRNAAVVDSINSNHVNPLYLTKAEIPSSVRATKDIAKAVGGTELLILAAPSHATRGLLSAVAPVFQAGTVIVSATKGIEVDTGQRMSQVVAEVLPASLRPRFVCLSGPSFAKEVVEK